MLLSALLLVLSLVGLPTTSADKVLAMLCAELNPLSPVCDPQLTKCETFVIEDNACVNSSLPYSFDGPVVFTCLRYESCLRVVEFEGPDCSTANDILVNTVIPCGMNAPCDDAAMLQATCSVNDNTAMVNQCVENNGTVTPVPFTEPNTPVGTCVANLPYPQSNPPVNVSLLLQGFEPSCYLVNVSSYFPSNHSTCTPDTFGTALLEDTQNCALVEVGLNGAGPSYGIRVTCAPDDQVAAAQYPPLPPHLHPAVRKAVLSPKRQHGQRRRRFGKF